MPQWRVQLQMSRSCNTAPCLPKRPQGQSHMFLIPLRQRRLQRQRNPEIRPLHRLILSQADNQPLIRSQRRDRRQPLPNRKPQLDPLNLQRVPKLHPGPLLPKRLHPSQLSASPQNLKPPRPNPLQGQRHPLRLSVSRLHPRPQRPNPLQNQRHIPLRLHILKSRHQTTILKFKDGNLVAGIACVGVPG